MPKFLFHQKTVEPTIFTIAIAKRLPQQSLLILNSLTCFPSLSETLTSSLFLWPREYGSVSLPVGDFE